MDLMTLDGNNQPAKLVEQYDSLIWTERYNTIGDFQLTTGDVDRFMTLLPEGTVVTLRETTVPMIVETHLIERKKNQPVKLTIKGRDYCSICDRRISVKDVAGTGEWTVIEYTPQDVAFFLMDLICTGGLDPLDEFDPALVQWIYGAYETSTGPTRSFTIPRGNLLSTVLQFIQAEAEADTSTTPDTPAVEPHGIRAIRPGLTTTPVQIEIYKGVDRSGTVYFDGTRDLLDDGSYLFSSVGSATTAFLLGSNSTWTIERNSASPASGFDRRVILVDGSNSNLDDSSMIENGKMSLAQARKTAMFDGSLNQDLNPYVYNVDYGLGDIVKLVGDYGLDKKARVTEYIRSEDSTGTKAYPTLSTIDS